MWNVWSGFVPACPQTVHDPASPAVDPGQSRNIPERMKRIGMLVLFGALAPWGRALPPTDYFEPDLTMYSFADLWVIRPVSAAILPLTMTTFAVGTPVAAGSGRDSVQRSYDILVGDPAEFLMARPLGSFFDWENRDKTKPVVIKFPDGYTVAELSPQQERRYRVALQEHKDRIMAIERETELPEADRRSLAAAEERRWENVLRLLLSL
jgi:hypothetical protein